MPSVLLDQRAAIGPHHLGIGKTRKLFTLGDRVFAFYSRGYEVVLAVCDARSGAILSQEKLELPLSWGGGAFCIDDDGAGRVVICFVNRDLRQFCFAQGRVSGDKIAWEPWRAILSSNDNQAAPWVSLDKDGTAWLAVLERKGNFRIASVTAKGEIKSASLFNPGDTPWYHSCVQILPIGDGQACAVGFRGNFPIQTELVGKMVGPDLASGPSHSVFGCNVNDHTTFHFQALGDPARGTAHIAYLDDGLGVSHAFLSDGRWQLEKSIIAVPCLAPQICLDQSGELIVLTGSYDGRVLETRKRPGGKWTSPVSVGALAGPNISPLFALTNYGTGGMISAQTGRDGMVPFMAATITDDRKAEASLFLHITGPKDARAPVTAEPAKPFAEETNAMMAQHPELILCTYKRMV